jgi:uncharacterized membrane protein
VSDVNASIDIDAPIDEVWALVMDPRRLEDWVTIHRELVSSTDTTMKQVMTLRGAPFTVEWKLTESRPPAYAHWQGRGPARSKAEIEYHLTETRTGTRFDYRNHFSPPGGVVGAVASRALVGHTPEREAAASLKQLKALLES